MTSKTIATCQCPAKHYRIYTKTFGSNLADSFPTEKEQTRIELLKGNNYYLDFIPPQRVEVKPGLYMLTSKLGWVLTGYITENVEDGETYMNDNVLLNLLNKS